MRQWWQGEPVFDLLCEKHQRLLQRHFRCHLLCLGPALLQWDLQPVLRRQRLHQRQHLWRQSHLCLRQWRWVHREYYLYRWVVLPECERLRQYLLLQ
jgi:hypothetical protein